MAVSSTNRMPLFTKKLIDANTCGEAVVVDLPRLLHRVEHADGGGQAVGQLLHRRRPRLLQVVAAHVHRVPQRDPLGAERDHVDDQPAGRQRREDVRAARQVLLDDVVLRGAPQVLAGHALLLGVGDVEAEQPRRRRVDRHRRVHLADRDAVEQLAHVPEVHHRHADLAHLALGEDVVGVVAGLGGQVEGDRQAGLALGQVGAVELVAGLGRRVPGVGADHPRTIRLLEVRDVMAPMIPPVPRGDKPLARDQAQRAATGRVAGGLEAARGTASWAPRRRRAWRGGRCVHCTSSRRSARRPPGGGRRARPARPSTRRSARWNIDSPANSPPMATP